MCGELYGVILKGTVADFRQTDIEEENGYEAGRGWDGMCSCEALLLWAEGLPDAAPDIAPRNAVGIGESLKRGGILLGRVSVFVQYR